MKKVNFLLSFALVMLVAFNSFANPPTEKTEMADMACSKQIVEKVPHVAANDFEILMPDGFFLYVGHDDPGMHLPYVAGLEPIESDLTTVVPIAWFDIRQWSYTANNNKAISLTARQLGLGNKKCPVPVGWI